MKPTHTGVAGICDRFLPSLGQTFLVMKAMETVVFFWDAKGLTRCEGPSFLACLKMTGLRGVLVGKSEVSNEMDSD